jgi:conjugal transfer pilus assembly protein TraB
LLLGGVDAPTGGQSQQNPHPVLIKVDDLAQLPNNLRFDVKSCHIIAAAHGDISSERAIMRLESMSCIDQNNVVYESNVRGFVFGEDGKAGVRGRVVTKEGQMLMNSLIAGIGAGIGQAFQQQAMTYSTSPLGTTSVIDPDQIVAAGLGTGVGTALDRLSRYYINLAEQLFPVMEVDAGRAVDVVFTSGFSFDRVEPMAQSNTFNQTINQAIGGDYLTDLVETGRRAAENIQKFGIQ